MGHTTRRGSDEDGPQNAKQIFAEELKAQREAAGLTQEQLANLMGYHPSLIARTETCRAMPTADFVRLADQVLKTPGTFTRARKSILNSAHESWLQAYLEIEERATVLRSWQPMVVQGLLQTEAYARAIIRAAHPGVLEAEVDQLVQLRMSRQAVLERTDPLPPMLWVILGEVVLRQPVGGPAVMREQLGRLADMSEQPRITIQIMPLSSREHPGLLGNFVVASFDTDPDAAYLDNALTGQVSERRKDVTRISLLYDTLRAEALSPSASQELIVRTAEEWT